MFVNENELKAIELRVKAIEQRFGSMKYETKSVVQSELSDGVRVHMQQETLHGVYIALCIDTVDIWKMNRVRFFCPLLDNPNRPIDEMQWAMPISSMGGFDDSGLNWVPPAGSAIVISFEGGNRSSPYYHGTVWNRNRGPQGAHLWSNAMQEYENVYEGHRKGYLVGPNDESQVLPPWNTESYNGFDLNSVVDFSSDPEAQKRITYPNIYGFKTPEKHMLKMVDGDPKCNRRWKRLEIMSSCGNWMMFKDDHIHYAGQWSHPSCGARKGDTSCVEGQDAGSPQEDTTRLYGLISAAQNGTESNASSAQAQPYNPKEKTSCEGIGSNKKIIGGHPDTGHPSSKYPNQQVGDNPYFKHQNECRPYQGPGTPQNNRCDLPQTGIQFTSISGHTFVMDDSVEEPGGDMGWERSLKPFDFGCNDNFAGRSYWKSATGHLIEMSDVEETGLKNAKLRSENNYIRIKSATGNKIELNDHTIGKQDCPGCPPNIAGPNRGIHIESTSKHTIDLCDDTNEQCSPCRREGGTPDNKAKKAYIKIRSGYGLEIMMSDSNTQQKETQQQFVQILAPQYSNECGPHIFRMQTGASKESSKILLRSGGQYIVSTCDSKIDVVGDKDKNPADYMEIVSRSKIVSSQDWYVNFTKKSHLFIAEENIYLLAGKDCKSETGDLGPCVGPVLVYQNGCVRLSDRVFASTSCTATPATIFMLDPLGRCPTKPCN